MNGHPASIHRHSLRVYYEDTDAGGIVYHANYLRFAERARTEALRAAGIPHATLVERFNLMFVVRRVEIDYIRPARLDEILTVETETLDVAAASVLLRQTVMGPDGNSLGVCAEVRIKLACVRIGENRPARIPPEWRHALAAMHHDAAGAAGTGD
jgi:acyl-CoA thioester hydrolase